MFGANLQNQNSNSLSIYVADEGRSFVHCDQDAGEAMVVAYDAPPGRYRELFENKLKPHTYFGLTTFRDKLSQTDKTTDYSKIPIGFLRETNNFDPIWTEISTHPTIYDISKRTVHGSSYRLGPNTMRKTILKFSRGKICPTVAECKMYRAMFFALFPEILIWQEIICQEARRNRVLHNMFGFPRRCEELFSDGYDRELISWGPQSTVACITHGAVLGMRKYIRTMKVGWSVDNNKHDAMITQCPDEDVEECSSVSKKLMEQELTNSEGVTFRMRASIKVSKHL